jgi:hypothetical protein
MPETVHSPETIRPWLWEWLAIGGLVAVLLLVLLVMSPLPQDPAYHLFADRDTILGVPHFWNVVSNLPFLAIGIAALWLLLRDGGFGHGRLFQQAHEKPPFLVLFLGVALTGLGSTYYHLDPTNERLLWDRLPMVLGFMGLFAGILGERIRPRVGTALLGPLLLLGIGSVLYWYLGERMGAGNLRPYLTVQFYPLLVIPLLILFRPARYTRGADYFIALGWYGLAKVLEQGDGVVYSVLGRVGGHPLKHVAAALGAFWILRMLMLRRSCASSDTLGY